MHERLRRPVAAIVAVVALTSAACAAPGTPSPSSSPPSPSPAQDIESVTREITGQVEVIRGLRTDEPLPVEVLDEAALVERVTTSFAEDNPPELVAATDGLYTRLELIPADASLGDQYIELLSSQILGLYDDETGILYVVDRGGGEAIGPLERFTISHEVDHALGDQAFDLSRLLPDVTDQSDRLLAGLSLAEGDASLLMVQWAGQHLTQAELMEVLAESQSGEQQEVLARMPRILADTLQFPYLQGLQFVISHHREGGWPAVDKVYDRPPVSTEQIMHPEIYAADDGPITVDMPDDLADLLGPGWSIEIEDTMGEFQTAVWLADAGDVPQRAADAAAAGWGGDGIAWLRGPDEADAVVWRTTWDSPTEAEVFAAAAESAAAALESPALVVHQSGTTDVTVIIASDQSTLVHLDTVVGSSGI